MKIEINKERIKYLLALYNMSTGDLLSLLNDGRKTKVEVRQINGEIMDLALLKRIDQIFDKGLDFYMDFSPLKANENNSVFFRKTTFGTELNRETIRVVNRFENLKQALDAYNKLSQYSIKSDIEHCTLHDSPKEIAQKIRGLLHPGKVKDAKTFLVQLIDRCAQHGIFVFEYVETWNKKEKTNIDGFFLQPNMIVLKRHKHYKREVFTLAHELGHCLLGMEEVESVDMAGMEYGKECSMVEKWCNDFAYRFIMGEYAEELNAIERVDASNDYCFDAISQLSGQTHISRLAMYTRLYLDKRISYANYCNVKNELAELYRIRLEQEKAKNEGKKGGTAPKPIISPLFLQTMQYAYFKGVINEDTFCRRLNVKPNKFEEMLWR